MVATNRTSADRLSAHAALQTPVAPNNRAATVKLWKVFFTEILLDKYQVQGG